jgi:hypothetical protein
MPRAFRTAVAKRDPPRAGWGRGWRPIAAVAAILALAVPAGAVSDSVEPTRSEYVAQLEKICQPGSEATQRAVRGMRADVRSERLRQAGTKFSKAKRIFAHTISSISTVARPEADRTTLSRWFAALERETVYLSRTAAALRAEDVARFQRVSAQFIHEGNKANNVVVSFGFNYCAFKPSRFQ